MSSNETENRTRFETVLLQMREMILSGALPPGSRVQEVAIGEQLGVSRTPVRLSLTVLEQEGLVRGEPNRGFTVRGFTVAEVLDSYDVRSVLEGLACRLIAERGLSEDEEAELGACLARGEALLDKGYFDASAIRGWSEMNGRFHRVIIQASNNRALIGAAELTNKHPLTAPKSIAFRTVNLERLYASMRIAQLAHATIVSALRQGQAVRAERVMAEHVFQSRETLEQEVRESGPALPEPIRKMLQIAD